jgi:UDP-N-acetylglucosamine--N-acetylmuramyl-(pentapeptide) pyrophosphoryl-undecaprenol N-acetylglucosamine transferase
MNKQQYKILLTGGGTGGSVTPLLAIAEELRGRSEAGEYNFLWIGTREGIEKGIVEKEGIIFRTISAGKWRRYFSWQNFLDPFRIIAGFFQSLSIILKWKPDLIISAGSFVSTPVVFAGWLTRVPIVIHQLDIRPGLSNKLAAPFAKVITVTFEKTLAAYGKKAVWTGNPIRPRLLQLYQEHRAKIKSDDESLPVVLVLGGGTGAHFINELVEKSLTELTGFCELIHITGKNKQIGVNTSVNYQSYEFLNLEELAWAYAAADVVISRAGMGTLTELAVLGKPTIIIPIPESHQEENTQIFHEQQAAIVLKQSELTPELFLKFIHKLLTDPPLLQELSVNIGRLMKKDATNRLCENVDKLLKN